MSNQSKGIIAFLAVIILFLMVLLYTSIKYPENEINDNSGVIQNLIKTTKDLEVSGSINDSTCGIGYPFYCYAWNIDEERNQISLEFMNGDSVDHMIKSISISNCDTLNPEISLGAGSRKLFLFSCSLTSETQFSRSISIKYN